MTPFFSIIVPTLNRCETLVETLKTITNQNYDDFELIISDNFSNDNTKNICSDLKSKFSYVKYINPGKTLSMSKHWEFALNHAQGEYVAFIGDDDGMVSNCLSKSYSILQKYNQPNALASLNCEYHWPSSPLPFHSNIGRYPLSKNIYICDTSEYINKVKNFQLSYRNLPVIYNGLVHRKIIAKIKEKSGSFFKSCIPDVYSGIAVASQTESYIFSDEPLFIYGVSGYSNGATASGSLSTNKKFFLEDSIPFHKKIPFCISIPMLVAESIYQCIDAKLIDEKFSPDPKILSEKAIIGALILGKERYFESVSAIQKYANSFGLDVSDLIERNPYKEISQSPFPDQIVWQDKILEKNALGMRMDSVGVKNIYDFFNLLPKKSDYRESFINILLQLQNAIQCNNQISENMDLALSKIATIKSSISWKITKPLRFIHNKILKIQGKPYYFE
jgi:glycosyltransferase involved in cell wall biosynthesis